MIHITMATFNFHSSLTVMCYVINIKVGTFNLNSNLKNLTIALIHIKMNTFNFNSRLKDLNISMILFKKHFQYREKRPKMNCTDNYLSGCFQF